MWDNEVFNSLFFGFSCTSFISWFANLKLNSDLILSILPEITPEKHEAIPWINLYGF